MSKIKILCIDDNPDSPEINGETLRKILSNSNFTYKIEFETNGESGINRVAKDKDIKLVLLDVEFTRQEKQGDQIAKDILKVRPELKVIVLTRLTETGKKISFGHKKNVVHYVIKQEISSADIQNKLKNIMHAVIDDYENKGWTLDYSDTCIKLTSKKGSFGINIPSMSEEAILECMKIGPNIPTSMSLGHIFESGKKTAADLNKVHNIINNNIREGTNWNTWGILTKEGCAKGQLKLVIGSVVPLSTLRTPKDPYVTQSQFDKLIRGFEEFKKDMLSKLEKLSKDK